MRYGSLFSGVEACTVAWEPLGWEAVVFAEFDKFPSAVLQHHYPTVPNVGDVTKHDWTQYQGKIDLLVGGSPCQSFSNAGKRLGMDDPRGNLALEFLKAVRDIQPRWFIFENVPGLLSSAVGRDFGSFLGEVADLGYGFAYRVLDAQNFGVPQRRRRVFVVGCADGDWERAGAVLLEPEGLSWDLASSREAGSGATTEAGASPTKGSEVESNRSDSQEVNSMDPRWDLAPHGTIVEDGKASALLASSHKDPQILYTMVPANSGKDFKAYEKDFSQTITTRCAPDCERGGDVVVAPDAGMWTQNSRNEVRWIKGDGSVSGALAAQHGAKQQNYVAEAVDVWNQSEHGQTAPTLTTGTGICNASGPKVMESEPVMSVRRLTPLESERLQGFPDNYTQIPWRNKPADQCPDGHRYKAMGNSMAVPVMRWIAERIDLVDTHLGQATV